MDPRVYVINRACDEARLTQYGKAAAAHDVAFTRVPALDGHDPNAPVFLYRDLLGDEFWGGADIKPGAFACFVSHMAAWRRFLAEGGEMALITEDDAVFTQPPGRLFTDARRLGEFDVIFANERMAGWREAGALKGAPKLVPLPSILARLASRGGAPGEDGLSRAPGADGYLVSRAGAQRLVEHATKMKAICGVDWLIVQAALDGDELPDCDELRYLADSPLADPPLKVFATSSPVVKQSSAEAGGSAIRHERTLPIEALREAPEIAAVGVEIEGPVARVPVGDLSDPVFAAFAAGHYYEKPALEAMRRWMPEGGTFVDIGAHVGNHTLFMLRHGGAGRAIPFEFNPRAIDHLRVTIEANDLTDRVDDQFLALGLGEGRGKLEAAGSRKNLSNVRLRPGFAETVLIRPADALLREIEVDFIKLDVGGEERAVLKGLRKTLKRKRPVVGVDMTRLKSQKATPFMERMGYAEAERVEWADESGDHCFVIFTSSVAPNVNRDPGDDADQAGDEAHDDALDEAAED